MADPVTKLHFAPNANLVNGTYAPGADGFNLADVGPSEVGLLPPGVKGLVWVGDTISGATASFQATINSLIGNPNVYGFYLADEPGPGNAANLKAESDYIHTHDPGAKTFILLLNNSSDSSPQFSYNPANTDIDLFGLDPYPVQTQYNGANYSIIGASVAAAQAQGIPLADIVPVYQAFGGGGYSSWIVPTATQEQTILSTWGQYVPAPAFDFAYSWGVQNNDTALISDPALQQVFAVHNAATSGSTGSLSGKVQLTGATEGTALPATTTIATFTDTNKADTAAGFTATIKWGDGTSSVGTISGSNGAFTVSAGHTYADEGSFALSATITRTADNTTITPAGTVASAEADVLTAHAATITGTAGQVLNNVTVATFTDTNTANAAGDFAAAIKWGDGTTSAGTVSGSKGNFTVTGSHTYAAAGTNAVAVTLTDDAPGTATATANSSAQIGSASGTGGGLTINSPVAGPVSYSASDSPVTVTSSGSVTSTGFNVDGIDGPSSGISAVNNFGTVTAAGSNGAGVYLQAGGTVTNNGGALLSGDYGVFTDGPSVVINSGTISGRTAAVVLGNSGPNRVVVNPTAVFNGLVDGRAAPSTLEFAGGTGSIAGLSGGSGTVSQNGTWSFANFQTLSVDAGGTWTLNGGKIASIVDNGTIAITGSLDVSTAIDPGSSGLFRLSQGATLEVAAALGSHVRMAFLGSSKLVIDNPASFGSNAGSPSYAGPQLQDFGAGDTIDLRQFSAAGAVTQYDPATGLLQVSNSAQQHASLEFQASSLGSGTFQVVSDGNGGILIAHG